MTDDSPAQKKMLAFINDPKTPGIFGQALAEIAVELMDAKAEAGHYKQSLNTVLDEIKVLAAVAMKKLGGERLVITKKDLHSVQGLELYCDTAEEGVRIYELRARVSKENDVEHAIKRILLN